MQILYVGYPLTDDGAPHQAMAALHLARSGVEVTYAAWGNQPAPPWLVAFPSLRYCTFRKAGLLSAIGFVWGVLRLLRSTSYDVVYVQGAQQTPFLLLLRWFLASRTVVYHTQDYLGPGQHWFYEWCEKRFARRADRVICNEINRARFMASSYRLQRMPEVIRTALPTWWDVPGPERSVREELLRVAGVSEQADACLIMAGGPYAEDRMSPQLVDALAGLPERFVLVFSGMSEGSRQHRTCADHAARRAVKHRVVMLGRQSYRELLRVCAACDVGVLLYPNTGVGHFYQAPGRLTEYLRAGVPILASNFPGLELLTLKFGIGAASDPYDPDAIRQALEGLGGLSREERSARRERLLELARSDFAYEAGADPVLQKVLGMDLRGERMEPERA